MQIGTQDEPKIAAIGQVTIVRLADATLVYDARTGLWHGSRARWSPEESEWVDQDLTHAEAQGLATMRGIVVRH